MIEAGPVALIGKQMIAVGEMLELEPVFECCLRKGVQNLGLVRLTR